MKSSKRPAKSLQEIYQERYATLEGIAPELREHVAGFFEGHPRIDRITARAKGVTSFLDKAQKKENGKKKYRDPLSQIQDQIGVRIVVFFRSDVERLDAIVKRYFQPIEYKDRVPDSEWEFGYFGRHYVLVLPNDVVLDGTSPDLVPHFFELQIKTLFQHAWSEVEHDLGYKPGEAPLTSEQKRKLAFTSAQAWGADQIFEELFQERQTCGNAS